MKSWHLVSCPGIRILTLSPRGCLRTSHHSTLRTSQDVTAENLNQHQMCVTFLSNSFANIFQ